MPWRPLLVLNLAVLSLSACVVAPCGRGGYGQWHGGCHNDGNNHARATTRRRTWRQDR